MSASSPLSADAPVIVDANVFFAIGRPSNPKYDRFRREVQRAGVVLQLPRRVVGELGGPETDRIRRALEEGWAEIVDAPPPEDADAVAASDIARRVIASDTRRPEHVVEKADTLLAGVTIQQLRDTTATEIDVLTDDVAARRGIETAIDELGYEDAVSVYGLADIIGDDPDGSLTVI
jgi:hypothetical protein